MGDEKIIELVRLMQTSQLTEGATGRVVVFAAAPELPIKVSGSILKVRYV